MIKTRLNQTVRCFSNFEIEHLPENVRKILFGEKKRLVKPHLWQQASQKIISSSNVENSPSSKTSFPDIDVVKFDGQIGDFFTNISKSSIKNYVHLCQAMLNAKIPKFPMEWSVSPGWTCYDADGNSKPIKYPESQFLFIDVEIGLTLRQAPALMAVAFDGCKWYSWCSELFQNKTAIVQPVIPINPNRALDSIIVGHNVGFDRQYLDHCYSIASTKLRFLDTMAMHIAVSGCTTSQRHTLTSLVSSKPKTVSYTDIDGRNQKINSRKWKSKSSLNNLADVHSLYAGGFPIHSGEKKTLRDIFVKGSLEDISSNFQTLMKYCASDVTATIRVFNELYPLYRKYNPHAVTFAATLIMGSSLLPVHPKWNEFVTKCDSTAHAQNSKVKSILKHIVYDTLEEYGGPDESWRENPWLCELDWSLPKTKKSKSQDRSEKNLSTRISKEIGVTSKMLNPETVTVSDHHFEKLFLTPTTNFNPTFIDDFLRRQYSLAVPQEKPMESFPKWFRNLLSGTVPVITRNYLITPRLLQLTWRGRPVNHVRGYGWGFFEVEDKLSANELSEVFGVNIPSYPENIMFFKLPHPSGRKSANVGSPLSNEFSKHIFSGALQSVKFQKELEQLMEVSSQMTYWNGSKDRIKAQRVLNDLILPQVVVHGTITRRASERTWLTAINARLQTLGSELKGMVVAPDGYSFVGADVDSQEMWIACLLGDRSFKQHGATAVSWMLLKGDRAMETDIHSYIARKMDISRNLAKVVNYARIYGAGYGFFLNFFMQQAKLSKTDASELAKSLIETTKGRKHKCAQKMYEFVPLVREVFSCSRIPHRSPKLRRQFRRLRRIFNIMGERFDTKIYIDILKEMSEFMSHVSVEWDRKASWKNLLIPVDVKQFKGGSESEMFNELETIASNCSPRTPVLGAYLSRALHTSNTGPPNGDLQATRINWVVQSSAVDYLHLLIVAMDYFTKEFDIPCMYAISIHDEVRYIVEDGYVHRATLALQLANLYTRAMFAWSQGYDDLPASVAFFSSVEVDKALRKDPHDDCITPSNPEGLLKAYGIYPGKSLTINDVLDITGGRLTL